MNTTALIVAAGTGSRMGEDAPKAYLPLAGRPLLAHCLEIFQAHGEVDAIVLMVAGPMLETAKGIGRGFPKVRNVAVGGTRRQDTVRLGLDQLAQLGLAGPEDFVLVHDAARPFVQPDLIATVLSAARRVGAAVPAVSPGDTVRRVSAPAAPGDDRLSAGTLSREEIVLIQTPQGFRVGLLLEAFERAGKSVVTDDAALVELIGHPVAVVSGSARNIKITIPQDLALARALLSAEER